jgi:hypothetical protein
VTSLSLEKIFEILKITPTVNLNIPNFLTVLILLTKKRPIIRTLSNKRQR